MNVTSGLSLFTVAILAVACAEQGRYGTSQTPDYADVGSSQVISSPRAAENAPPPAVTQGNSAADSDLAYRVRQNLNSNTVSGVAQAVNILAQDGNVTLTGSVPSDTERRQVDDVARNTSGVAAVYDQLQVAPSANYTPVPAQSYTSQPAEPTGRMTPSGNTISTGDIFNLHVQGLNETDRTLAERILHGLRTDTALSSLLPVVNIQVVNGRVVLQGTVQNEQQRQTIASVVERAAGAGQVENQLQVAR